MSASPVAFDMALHDELVAMLERDQADREGPADRVRPGAHRPAKDIIRAHGWSAFALVGEDGGNAAWPSHNTPT
ncbi:hypothetical protein ACIBCL_28305 [Micromonospora zamorensis]|uniref:hypothetical protein n=1 Tax=Micromonospora zamorensis TaxID=709883 RepID=UPI00378B255F